MTPREDFIAWYCRALPLSDFAKDCARGCWDLSSEYGPWGSWRSDNVRNWWSELPFHTRARYLDLDGGLKRWHRAELMRGQGT